jgi:hypothetical protein
MRLSWLSPLRRIALLAGLCIGLSSAGASVRAQTADEERSQAFKPVEGAIKEDVPGGPLLIAAYGSLWLFLLGYGFRLIRLQQRAEADVQRLERALARDRPAGPGAG